MAEKLGLLQQLARVFNHRFIKGISILFLFSLFSCTTANSDTRILDDGETKVVGKRVNFLEEGRWTYYNKKDSVLQTGLFEKGVRVGTWKYFIPNFDTICWKETPVLRSGVRTNVPEHFEVFEDTNNFSDFIDTSSGSFNLMIGVDYSTGINGVESYRKKSLNGLYEKGVVLSDSVYNTIRTPGRELGFIKVSGKSLKRGYFGLMNQNGYTDNGKFIEVTLVYNPNFEQRAKRIFFSVVPNLFIDAHRFIEPKERIIEFK